MLLQYLEYKFNVLVAGQAYADAWWEIVVVNNGGATNKHGVYTEISGTKCSGELTTSDMNTLLHAFSIYYSMQAGHNSDYQHDASGDDGVVGLNDPRHVALIEAGCADLGLPVKIIVSDFDHCTYLGNRATKTTFAQCAKRVMHKLGFTAHRKYFNKGQLTAEYFLGKLACTLANTCSEKGGNVRFFVKLYIKVREVTNVNHIRKSVIT